MPLPATATPTTAPVDPNLTLSVFFPAYYDEKNITGVVEQAVTVLEALPLAAYEIIIIEDGSPDNTAAVADQLAQRFAHVRVIHHARNMGYGATLKDGFLNAQYAYVFYTDGDNQFDLNELKKFVALIPFSDLVIGYRRQKQYSPWRKFTSATYNWWLRRLFHIAYSDVNCAFKLINTNVFKKISIRSTHGFIDAEIILKAQALGYTITEVGVTHLPRKAGISTGARPEVIWGTIRETWQYYRHRS